MKAQQWQLELVILTYEWTHSLSRGLLDMQRLLLNFLSLQCNNSKVQIRHIKRPHSSNKKLRPETHRDISR